MSITIDTVTYDIPIIEQSRSADMLYKYAERLENGNLKSELIGVYFNYKGVKLGAITDTTTYTNLWQKLTEPVEYHAITMYDEDGTYTFNAYFSNIKDAVRKVVGSTPYWKGLSFDVIAISPARVPS
jgi:hypothetical protein